MTARRRCRIPVLLLTAAAAVTSIQAQSRAALSQPVIRRSGDDVLLVCRVTDTDPERSYRVGLGVAEQSLDFKLEVLRDGLAMSEKPASFEQGHASGWWGVDTLQSYGVTFSGGGELSLTVRVNREHARSFDRVFLFLSREYTAGTWYLEDGVELKRTHW